MLIDWIFSTLNRLNKCNIPNLSKWIQRCKVCTPGIRHLSLMGNSGVRSTLNGCSSLENNDYMLVFYMFTSHLLLSNVIFFLCYFQYVCGGKFTQFGIFGRHENYRSTTSKRNNQDAHLFNERCPDQVYGKIFKLIRCTARPETRRKRQKSNSKSQRISIEMLFKKLQKTLKYDT